MPLFPFRAIRRSPSGPRLIGGVAGGTFVGTWDGVAFPATPVEALLPPFGQRVVTGFRPKTVQLVARIQSLAGGGLFDGGVQLVRSVGMPVTVIMGTEVESTFIQTPFGFNLILDIPLITFTSDGFIASLIGNALPGTFQPAVFPEPGLPDFYAFEAEG